jgi:uncharacterized protein (TIGR03435 family)
MRPDGSTVAVDVNELNGTMLDALISGSDIRAKQSATAVSLIEKSADGKPIDGGLPDISTIKNYPLNILDLSPSTVEGMSGLQIMGSKLIANAQMSARAIIACAYGLTTEGVEGPAEILDKPWRIIIRTESPEAMRKVLVSKIDSAFGVRSRMIERDKTVLLLKQSTTGIGKDLEKLDSTAVPKERRSYSDGAELGSYCTMLTLAEMLAGHLGQPVLNETGLNGRWKWTLSWDATAQDAKAEIRRAVEQQFGLKLESALRKRNVVMVEPN